MTQLVLNMGIIGLPVWIVRITLAWYCCSLEHSMQLWKQVNVLHMFNLITDVLAEEISMLFILQQLLSFKSPRLQKYNKYGKYYKYYYFMQCKLRKISREIFLVTKWMFQLCENIRFCLLEINKWLILVKVQDMCKHYFKFV